ncbi:isoprenylcysteine carboxylmethyltransferase family protein [Parahaliea sp. F7430]|uniref:Isoprenylcysteine carboxylmethyltransferase family protein n=1 Tax=Sediminihaliea albiluteola TaxID=2758564 RepID=A0A7W2TY92_9GAMM|nr:isoprenylcysteine carboxylmethyltransferase family protein [Sediminihaliea albiluteola]MBA6414163.1 isoprenylcysteine carboxylmethyltransferase family protein [Sediminihaliea albiluteola]
MVKRVIYPPLWLVIALVSVFALNEFLPGPRFTGLASQLIGGAILLFGLALLVLAGGLFKRAGTDMIPFKNVTALVTEGVYSWTRNPMYLGMALVLLSAAVTVGASTALLIPPLFMLVIEWRYIRPEEAMLRDLFGQQYLDYCQNVRRWL